MDDKEISDVLEKARATKCTTPGEMAKLVYQTSLAIDKPPAPKGPSLDTLQMVARSLGFKVEVSLPPLTPIYANFSFSELFNCPETNPAGFEHVPKNHITFTFIDSESDLKL